MRAGGSLISDDDHVTHLDRPRRSRAARYPRSPLPRQHQSRPGRESQMRPRPQYQAAAYPASGRLTGRVALITGFELHQR